MSDVESWNRLSHKGSTRSRAVWTSLRNRSADLALSLSLSFGLIVLSRQVLHSPDGHSFLLHYGAFSGPLSYYTWKVLGEGAQFSDKISAPFLPSFFLYEGYLRIFSRVCARARAWLPADPYSFYLTFCINMTRKRSRSITACPSPPKLSNRQTFGCH